MEGADFFSGWSPLLSTVVLGFCAYATLALLLALQLLLSLASVHSRKVQRAVRSGPPPYLRQTGV